MRVSYQDIDEAYEDIVRVSSGRQACSVMIMVANEVDAMASTRMLAQLFRSDNIAYVIRPVSNITQVKQVFDFCLTSDIKIVILMNCGAIYNIPKLFDLEGKDIRVLILDNHRPMHLANVYSRYNVLIFDDVSDVHSIENDELYPSDGTVLTALESSSDESSSNGDDKEIIESDDENIEDEEAEFEDDNEEENLDEDVESIQEDEINESGEGKDDDQSITSKKSLESNSGSDADVSDNEEDNNDDDDDSTVTNEPKAEVKEEAEVIYGNDNTANNKTDEMQEEADTSKEDIDLDTSDAQIETAKALNPTVGATDDAEEDEVIVGKRRKTLDSQYNPVKIRRRKLRDYYTQNASYTAPTSIMLLNLVYIRYGSQLPLDLIWQAIIGMTDQYIKSHITELSYEEFCNFLREQLDKQTPTTNKNKYIVRDNDTTDTIVPGSENGNISEGLEYRFFMYRHWSLYDSMYYSPYIASKLLVWQSQGTSKLQELLAKIGMPLQQSKQQFNFIIPSLRNHFRKEILDKDSKQEYNLINPDVLYRSFYRFNSFKNQIAASDIVLASTALLEVDNDNIDIDEVFARPQVLKRLGQYIMDVKCNMPVRDGGWANNSLLPLVMLSQKRDTYIVVGISPLTSTLTSLDNTMDKYKNRLKVLTNFRHFFKYAAEDNNARYWNDAFDTNIVEIHKDDAFDFLGDLNELMKRASNV
eukprot:gene18949-24757_t